MSASTDDRINLVGSTAGMAPNGVVAGRIPSTVGQVTIERDGEHVAEAEITETSHGRFFAAEVPGVGTYRVTASLEDGTEYGSVDVEVRDDGLTSVVAGPGDIADR